MQFCTLFKIEEVRKGFDVSNRSAGAEFVGCRLWMATQTTVDLRREGVGTLPPGAFCMSAPLLRLEPISGQLVVAAVVLEAKGR